MSWTMLAFAQLHTGHVQLSLASGRRGLALSQEIKNVWTQVVCMSGLTVGLLEVEAYEGALGLIQQAIGLARTLPLTLQVFLLPLGSVYHALQQWQEARAALEEIEAIAERLNLGLTSLLPILTRLCLHWAVAGEWEAASRYAKGETS